MGTATPAFFAILFIVVASGVAAAAGASAIKAFVVGLAASYLVFIGMVSRFDDSSSIALAAGIGLLALIPAASGLVIATYIGHLVHQYLQKNKRVHSR
jgi:hypothetical protein